MVACCSAIARVNLYTSRLLLNRLISLSLKYTRSLSLLLTLSSSECDVISWSSEVNLSQLFWHSGKTGSRSLYAARWFGEELFSVAFSSSVFKDVRTTWKV